MLTYLQNDSGGDPADVEQIKRNLLRLQADEYLLREANLDARSQALYYLDFVDQVVHMRSRWQDLSAMRTLAGELRQRLEMTNMRLLQELRQGIRSGHLVGQTLRRQLDRFTRYVPGTRRYTHTGPDGLDVLVRGLFGLDRPPAAGRLRDAEMIDLEFTPASAILDLVDHARFAAGNVFYDLGAGLGQVVMLVHLLTGIITKGVEVEPAYCAFARQRAQELNLRDVEFINVDARYADYADGTLFYLFTPFKGKLLRWVLDKLRAESERRLIRVCTFGPCTATVAQEPWLAIRDPETNHPFRLAVFDSG